MTLSVAVIYNYTYESLFILVSAQICGLINKLLFIRVPRERKSFVLHSSSHSDLSIVTNMLLFIYRQAAFADVYISVEITHQISSASWHFFFQGALQ